MDRITVERGGTLETLESVADIHRISLGLYLGGREEAELIAFNEHFDRTSREEYIFLSGPHGECFLVSLKSQAERG